MPSDRIPRRYELIVGGGSEFWEIDDEELTPDFVVVRPPESYRQAFGDEPIRLGMVEFQVLLYLASRPYHAFTRRQIAAAVSAAGQTLSEEDVDAYIATLRDQLGVLHDFVQTVPHIGFRYKA